MKTTWMGLSLAGLAFGLGACQAERPHPPAAPGAAQAVSWRVLHAGDACGSVQPSLVRLSDAAALAAAWGEPPGLQDPPAPPTALPPVDFKHTWVLKLSMGQLPSAGGQFRVQSVERPAAHPDQLTIRALWKLPEPGGMHAQVVTQPCIILALARGNERSVQVVDQSGQTKARLELDARQ